MARLAVRLQAGAGKNQIVEMRDDRLIVRVAAPPVDGRANRALCKVIAKRFSVARSQVSIVSGERSRDKVVEIAEVDEAAVAALISAL